MIVEAAAGVQSRSATFALGLEVIIARDCMGLEETKN